MVCIDSVDELVDKIKKEGTIVYGTGYVAERFIVSLEKRGLKSKVSRCVTTIKNQESFMGVVVTDLLNLKEQYRGELICIAVHESIKDEIIDILNKYSFENYIWIYPFQHKLRFGEPIEINKETELSRIIETTKDDYRIPIRLAAINQFYGKSKRGYSIYIKGQRLHCDEDTARKRLARFIELIRSWELNGFLNEQRPCISEDYEVLDGVHRISLAIFHRMKSLPCDIYRVDNISEYRSKFIDITADCIYKAGFNSDELLELDRIEF